MKVRQRVLVLLAALSVVTYLDRVCIAVAGPRMQQELNLSPSQWGWVVGVFALAYGAFEIPNGILADRFGPRRMLVRIVAWWSAFTALTGTVRTYPALLATRFLFGAGEAGAYPNVSAVAARWFPHSERGRVFGVVWMSSQMGGALAPVLVVPLMASVGWRGTFHLFGAAGIVWTLAWWRGFRDLPSRHPAMTDAERTEIESGTIAGAGGSLPLSHLARDRNLRAVLIVALAYVYAMYFFIAWVPTYMMRSRGMAEDELAYTAAPFLLGAAANLGGGWAGDRIVGRLGVARGRRVTGVTGLLLAALALAAALSSSDPYATLGLMAVCYAGICFQQPSVWAACTDIGGRASSGAVSGAMNSAGQLGSFLLSLSYGYLVEFTGSYDTAAWPIVAVLLTGALAWLAVDPAPAGRARS